jgi:hypothetical protein
LTAAEVKDFFERFARGKTLPGPTLVSNTFATQMMTLLHLEDCLIDNDRVDMVKVNRKLEEGTFEPDLFNQMIRIDCSFVVRSSNHKIE